jgi:hypothetical protein
MVKHMPHYDRIFEIMAELGIEKSVRKILDIGCSKGGFVEELRARGYDAHGLEAAGRHLDPAKDYLHNKYIWEIPTYFTDNFDLMVASRVMSKESVEALFRFEMDKEKLGLMESLGIETFVESTTRTNNQNILEGANARLNLGGYLIAIETDNDAIYITPTQVQEAGLQVVRLQPQEMVLRK